MIITSDQIRKELKDIWRDLQFIWPTNPSWPPMPDDLFPEVIEHCSVKHMVFTPGFWECENYAYRWMSNVEVYIYELYKAGKYKYKSRPLAGACIGLQSDIFGNVGTHGLDIVRLESGWVLFEPQTDIVTKDFYSYIPFHIKF